MGSSEKLVSRTGAVGAALGVYGIVKWFYPQFASYIPEGLVEVIVGGLVVFFRRVSDGKTPKVV